MCLDGDNLGSEAQRYRYQWLLCGAAHAWRNRIYLPKKRYNVGEGEKNLRYSGTEESECDFVLRYMTPQDVHWRGLIGISFRLGILHGVSQAVQLLEISLSASQS